jgi:hypothetical protein
MLAVSFLNCKKIEGKSFSIIEFIMSNYSILSVPFDIGNSVYLTKPSMIIWETDGVADVESVLINPWKGGSTVFSFFRTNNYIGGKIHETGASFIFSTSYITCI